MKNSVNTGTETAWMMSRKTRLPVVLAKKIVTAVDRAEQQPVEALLVLLLGERAVQAEQHGGR